MGLTAVGTSPEVLAVGIEVDRDWAWPFVALEVVVLVAWLM